MYVRARCRLRSSLSSIELLPSVAFTFSSQLGENQRLTGPSNAGPAMHLHLSLKCFEKHRHMFDLDRMTGCGDHRVARCAVWRTVNLANLAVVTVIWH